MNTVNDFSGYLQKLVNAWHLAPGTPDAPNAPGIPEFSLEDKIKLAETTEQAVAMLQDLYENNQNPPQVIAHIAKVILGGFEKYPEWKSKILAKWIAQNALEPQKYGQADVTSMNVEGQIIEVEDMVVEEKPIDLYRPLHHLFAIATKMKEASLPYSKPALSNSEFIDLILEPEETLHRPKGLAYVDEYVNCYISAYHKNKVETNEANAQFGDLETTIAFQISPKSNMKVANQLITEKLKEMPIAAILYLKKSSKHNAELVLPEIIERLNEGLKISAKHGSYSDQSLGIESVKELITFFEDQCDKVECLDLNITLNTAELNEIAKKFLNLKKLILSEITDEYPIFKLENKFNSLAFLCLNEITDFDSFDNLIEGCPKLIKLKCSNSKFVNLKVLNNLQSLAELEFHNCNVNNLRGIFGFSCNIKKMTLDGCDHIFNLYINIDFPKLTHLLIKDTTIGSFYDPEPFKVDDFEGSSNITHFSFADSNRKNIQIMVLKKFPNLQELDANDLFLANDLQACQSLTDLTLSSFTSSSISVLKDLPNLKNLTLKSSSNEIPLDLSELNQCLALETLTIKSSNVDFCVSKNHPPLQMLHIDDHCSNLDVAQDIETKNLRVTQ